MNFKPGISIVLPSYNNSLSLDSALHSIARQTIPASLVEVIVVLNGGYDTSLVVVDDFRAAYPDLEIVCVTCSKTGAGHARNIGLSVVSRTYVTFLDDDDQFEEEFLERAWLHCAQDSIVLLGITNESLDGSLVGTNFLDMRIGCFRGARSPVASLPWALGFNASKVFPAWLVENMRFDENLRSGEDVVFFSQFLKYQDLRFVVPSDLKGARYRRFLSDSSLSRQEDSFDFAVVQRLECIAKIQPFWESRTVTLAGKARRVLLEAQFEFIRTYLRNHPEETSKAIDAAVGRGVAGLPWGEFRTEKAHRAVISYCFPPFADTAGNVAAKRIRERGELVDVYSANMGKVRSIDSSSLLMVEEFLGTREVLNVPVSFSNWFFISNFAVQAARRASKRARCRSGYESLYTRSMWSGSHVAGVLFKAKHAHVEWEAEFSDPMRIDALGNQRTGKITPHPINYLLRRIVTRAGLDPSTLTSHFALTEAATFIYADTLVFTNGVQRDLMLEPYPQDLREVFLAKSRVAEHTIPDTDLYSLVETSASLDARLINIGYFGTFYENRGIGDVVKAISALSDGQKRRVRLYIYCPDPEKTEARLLTSGAVEQVIVRSVVPYLEFLNLATQFDVLLVSDTDISGTCYDVNPFLPSKYSDYRGAGVPIWGIVSRGSPLSGLRLEYRSYSEDSSSIETELLRIITGSQ